MDKSDRERVFNALQTARAAFEHPPLADEGLVALTEGVLSVMGTCEDFQTLFANENVIVPGIYILEKHRDRMGNPDHPDASKAFDAFSILWRLNHPAVLLVQFDRERRHWLKVMHTDANDNDKTVHERRCKHLLSRIEQQATELATMVEKKEPAKANDNAKQHFLEQVMHATQSDDPAAMQLLIWNVVPFHSLL